MSYEIKPETVPERLTLVKRAHLPGGDLTVWLHRTFLELFSYIADCNAPVTGPPFAAYAFDGGVDVEAGLPVAAPVSGEGDIIMSSLPGTEAAVTSHVGAYDRLIDACDALEKWIHDHGFERAGRHWEVYMTDPRSQPDPERRLTVVIMPYRIPPVPHSDRSDASSSVS